MSYTMAKVFLPLLWAGITLHVAAQDAAAAVPDAPEPQMPLASDVHLTGVPRDLLAEQAAIWTSPAHLNESNAMAPALIVLASAAFITTDHQMMNDHVPVDKQLNDHAITASNGLLGGFVAAPAIIYVLGRMHRDDHATETGILAGEAMTDSLVVDEVMKLIARRERPALDNARGKFFQSGVGTDSSFPSTHAFIAWSSAAVIATEYDGLLTQITAYGLAAGVSATRVVGREHFPSDVVVGSALGWMIGRYVAHRHHATHGDYY